MAFPALTRDPSIGPLVQLGTAQAQGTPSGALSPSTSRHDPDDLQAISGPDRTFCELGRGDRLSIVLHDDASGQKPATHEELLEGARKLGRNGFAIGDHGHAQRLIGRSWK